MSSTKPTAKAKIRVRNFQALSDVKLEAEGLTVITGKSNVGKSAFIRAIRTFMFGRPGDHYIRNGESWTGGSILLENQKGQLKVSWRKAAADKKNKDIPSVLEINGTQHTKVGREHRTLTEPHGFQELELTTGRLTPQVAMQHDQPFLATESETTVAEVFKLLSRTDVVAEAQRLEKKDLKATEDRKKVRADDRNRAEARLREFDHLPKLKATLATAKQACELREKEEQHRLYLRDRLQELKALHIPRLPKAPTKPVVPTSIKTLLLLRELRDIRITKAPTPPTLKPVPILPAKLLELKRLNEDQIKTRREWDQAKEEWAVLQFRKGELERILKICPTCNRKFGDNHDH